MDDKKGEISPQNLIDKCVQTRYINKGLKLRNAPCNISALPNLAEIDQGVCHLGGYS